MTISMYHASIPRIANMLQSLLHILEKAEQHVEAKKWSEAALTQFRLYPDMLPFTRQILIACDAVKNGLARLSGLEAPKFDDTETTLAQLQERIQKTLAFVATVPAAALDGTEAKEITFPAGPGKTRTLKGQDYLTGWMLPNMYFHITTAYAILRHNGVEVGKRGYQSLSWSLGFEGNARATDSLSLAALNGREDRATLQPRASRAMQIIVSPVVLPRFAPWSRWSRWSWWSVVFT